MPLDSKEVMHNVTVFIYFEKSFQSIADDTGNVLNPRPIRCYDCNPFNRKMRYLYVVIGIIIDVLAISMIFTVAGDDGVDPNLQIVIAVLVPVGATSCRICCGMPLASPCCHYSKIKYGLNLLVFLVLKHILL